MSRRLVTAIGRLLLALARRATAETANSTDWDQLLRLRPGEKIRVELREKEPITAAFRAVMPDRLQVVGAGIGGLVGRFLRSNSPEAVYGVR